MSRAGMPVLLIVALVGQLSVAGDPNPAPSNVLCEFAISSDPADPILVPVHVAGKAHLFVLDTGATCTVVDAALQSHLGNRVGTRQSKTFTGATVDVDAFEARNLAVADIPWPEEVETVLTKDLRPLRELIGDDVRGILGMDFLSKRVLEIDHDNDKVRFLKKADIAPAEALPISFRPDATPTVSLELPGGITRSFVIDTGMLGEACCSRPTFRQLQSSGEIQSLGQQKGSDFVGTTYTAKVGRLRELGVGSHRVPSSIVSSAGNCAIGHRFLTRFQVTFDFPAREIALKPSRNFARRDPYIRIGSTFRRRNGGVVFEGVEPEGRGWKAGIRDGDLLVRVDDLDVDGLRFAEISQRMCTPGQESRIQIVRGAMSLDFVVPAGFEVEAATPASE